MKLGHMLTLTPRPPSTLTGLLTAWSQGDSTAADRLLPLVYDELRQIAKHLFKGERSDHTLEPTAVVHETYLRLAERVGVPWRDRRHFYAFAARTMRHILVDHARGKRRLKRGADDVVRIEDIDRLANEHNPDIVAVDDSLRELAELDPRKAAIVELHFFGGLSVAETAEILGLSTATVVRHWRMAKAWLLRELTQS